MIQSFVQPRSLDIIMEPSFFENYMPVGNYNCEQERVLNGVQNDVHNENLYTMAGPPVIEVHDAIDAIPKSYVVTDSVNVDEEHHGIWHETKYAVSHDVMKQIDINQCSVDSKVALATGNHLPVKAVPLAQFSSSLSVHQTNGASDLQASGHVLEPSHVYNNDEKISISLLSSMCIDPTIHAQSMPQSSSSYVDNTGISENPLAASIANATTSFLSSQNAHEHECNPELVFTINESPCVVDSSGKDMSNSKKGNS